MKAHEIEDFRLYCNSGLIKSLVKSRQIDKLPPPPVHIKAILISILNAALPNFSNL